MGTGGGQYRGGGPGGWARKTVSALGEGRETPGSCAALEGRHVADGAVTAHNATAGYFST